MDWIRLTGYALVFLLGLCAADILSIPLWRLPKRVPLSGRSACPSCGGAIQRMDLLPLLGFLILRGRCRRCRGRILRRYPLMELGLAALWLLCCLRFGFTLQALLACVLTLLLLCIAVIDVQTMEIPNLLVLALLLPAAAACFLFPEIGLLQRGIGLVCVSLPMLLLTLTVPGAFGGGDVKLIAVCGLLLGWQKTLLATFLALLFGGIYAIVLLLLKRVERKQHIPFGQYICAGVYLALLYGDTLIQAYLDVFWKR